MKLLLEWFVMNDNCIFGNTVFECDFVQVTFIYYSNDDSNNS